MTQGNGPWGDLSWSYDHIGNRLTETRDGTTDTYAYLANAADGNTALLDQVTLGVGGTRDYTFGPAGHLTRVTAGAHQVNLEIDSAGRLAAFERPAADSRSDLTYDGRGFLTHAAEPGEIFADGFESGDFACWSNVVGGTKGGTCPDPPAATGSDVVEPVYDSQGLLRSRRADAGDVHVLYFAGRPVALLEVADAGLTFLTTDHLGTPVLATDETGAATWAGGFEPFGRDWNGAAQAGVFLRLPGQWTDPAWEDASLGADVYYNVHRWYGPKLGRYTRPDPLAILPDLEADLYEYAAGNPLLFVDPDGLRFRLPNPMAQIECAKEVGRRRSQPGQFPAGTSDKFKHCVVTCEIQIQCGILGALTAAVGKELRDLLDFDETTNPDLADFVADYEGIFCATDLRRAGPPRAACRDCNSCCESGQFRGQALQPFLFHPVPRTSP